MTNTAYYWPSALAKYASPYPYQIAPHLKLLNKALYKAATKDDQRIVVSMPPRHGKTELVRAACAWYIGTQRNKQVLFASYEADFAAESGGAARDLMREHGEDVFGVVVDKGQDSRNHWRAAPPLREESLLTGRARQSPHLAYSIMRTAGLGGPVTGKGADLLVVDDPVKSHEDALSAAARDSKWEWWRSVAYPRLHTGGSAVVVQCMTGDTPVLMADGTERALRDVRVGDRIATYDQGRLQTTKVQKHRNNGRDSIVRITTISGRMIRANHRHPFLVEEDGRLKWIRLRDLTTAHTIVVSKAKKVSGKGRPASGKDARNPQNVEGIASRTIGRRCGPMDTGLRPSRQKVGVASNSSIATASPPQTTTRYSKHKTENAPYAGNRLERMFARIGKAACASIIAMRPTPSAPSCATTVTSRSATPRTSKRLSQWSNTSDFTTEQIASIEPDGIEEVFDLQVERTENFIANGVVSHNTRWHMDDLAGRLIQLSEDGIEHWDVINLPAIAEDGDPLGREPGEALWPEKYPVERLATIREVQGPYWWSALYQGRPTPLEGGIFKWDWMQERYDKLPGQGQGIIRTIQSVDAAFKTGVDNDYSVIATWATDGVDYYLIDVWRAKVEFHALKQGIVDQFWKHEPSAIYIEDAAAGQSVIQELQRETMLPVIGKPVWGNDISRAHAVSGIFEAKKVKLPRRAPWLSDWITEHTQHPNGAHDDQVTTTYYALEELAYQGTPIMEFV